MTTFSPSRLLSCFFAGGLAAAMGLGCGGSAEVGEACTERGSAEECVDGAVCDAVEGEGVVCLKGCIAQSDCAADESCNGLTNATGKACHPKSAAK